MKATVFETLSNEKKPVIVQAGKTLRESLKEYSLENAVIIVNGKVQDADYVMKENDVAMIRLMPGALTAGAIAAIVIWATVTVAVVGYAVGSTIYANLMDKNQRELEKLKKQMNRPEVDNRPFLRGASNTVATGNSQPYIIGRHLFTPYLLCSPFYKITGEDGKDQYTYTVLECGFNKQVIDTVSVDDIEIKKFTGTTPQQGAFDIDSGVFAEEGKLEISQNGTLLSELSELNYKVVSKSCNQEIPRESEVQSGDKEYLTYTLSPNAMNVDVAITFPYGLYATDDDGDQISTQVTITPEYSLDGGQTYTAFTFDNNGTATNTFKRNVSSKELRYVAHVDFTVAQYNTLKANGQNAIWLRIRSNGNKDTRIHNDCYCLFYQSRCYDAEKSINQNGIYTSLTPCRVVEDRERAYCTIMGLKVKASKINEEKLTKINIITQGVARIWNGSRWSTAKTVTSNPAAWALEILTSDSHPASRYSDDEIDTGSFGEFYEYCEDNNFSFDWVITNNQKKSDVLNNILASANACLYFDIYGRLAVSIDRAQENAIAVYNPQNIISIENKKSFTRRTDAIRIKYTNAEDDIFQEDTYLVKREINGVPVTIDENSIIKDVSVTGITHFSQIVKYARRIMAIEELRPKTTTISVGNEGIYYTPYSKVLIQDDSLKIGLGKGYVISACIWDNGTLTHIKTSGKVNFEAGKQYGIIVNCYTEDRVSPVAIKVSGAGETDLLNVLTPIYGGTTDAVPEVGNVFSFGELDESGEFTKVTTEYLISNITRESNGFSLELVNYNEAIYDSGTIPAYVSNITPRVSDTGAEIPQDIVTKAELHEEVASAIGDVTLDVEYSADGTNWHSTFVQSTDLYMRQSTDGGTTWTDAMRIVGEQGEQGDPGASSQQYQCVYSDGNIYLYGLASDGTFRNDAQPYVQYDSTRITPPRTSSGYCLGYSNVYATAFLAILNPSVMPLTWTIGETYVKGLIVSYTAGGVDYGRFICMEAHTASDEILPTDTDYWRPANVLEVYYPYDRDGEVRSSLTKTSMWVSQTSAWPIENSNFIIVGKIRHTGTLTEAIGGYVENITPIDGASMWDKLRSQISFQGIVGEIPANTNYMRFLYRIDKDSDVFRGSVNVNTPEIGTLVFARGVTSSNYTNEDGTVDTIKGLRLWNGVTWDIVDQANTIQFWEECRNKAMLALVGVAKVYSAHNVPVPDECGAVFDLLIANKAFIEQLSAEQIVFQDYVASSSSKNPSSGDMMIYMGKNPANYTATSEFQFALSKYIGQIGGSQMWSDLFKTKLLSSGLLALMLSGCVQTTDAVYSHAGEVLEETDFVDEWDLNISEDYDCCKNIAFLNNSYIITTLTGAQFVTTDFKTYSVNENLKHLFSNSEEYNSSVVFKNKLFVFTNKAYYYSSDLTNWTRNLLNNKFEKAIAWEAAELLITVEKESETLFHLSTFNGTTWNTIEISSSDVEVNDTKILWNFSSEYINYIDIQNVNSLTFSSIENPLYDGYSNEVIQQYNNDFYVRGGSNNTSLKKLSASLSEGEIIVNNIPLSNNDAKYVFSDIGIFFVTGRDLYFYDFQSEETLKIKSFETTHSGARIFIQNNILFFVPLGYENFNNNGYIYVSPLTKDFNFVKVEIPHTLADKYASSTNNPKDIYGVFFINDTYLIFEFIYEVEKMYTQIYISRGREAGSGIIAESKGTSQNWVRFSNGLLAQWGIVYKGSSLAHGSQWDRQITLPLTYPDTNYHAMVTAGDQGGGGNEMRERTDQRTASTIRVNWYNRNGSVDTDNPSISWLTLGWG